ncbi:helix-turn-helix domain-containing protein [[Haemophilus] felis]|uniref:Transcriptional regulator n=1 Tax=[Haemophilus] felis TaxID=123822 RepID=A0A1T0AU67_9PAST|nr:helix-turn-helix domain-containing protein [[Haemophilus] felis]NBI41816.1 helix-turn-helix domain-containing protein [[Haemophilus] felis]NBI43895.1 helix-turn-helix domain-containing protein [[Haemophilus] felis]OOS00009.1 transcriptional regulator [[Haemophilus] felis]
MKVQPIDYKQVKETLLQDQETKTLYIQERRIEELQLLLKELRQKAGLTVYQVAERMGVSQPAVSRLEKNASRATFRTLQRYAQACGSELRIGVQ